MARQAHTRQQITAGEAKRLARKIAAAKAALWWERLAPALMPAASIVGVFVAISLLGLWDRIAPVAHVIGLAGFAMAVPAALWWGFTRFKKPTELEAVRRIERDGELLHRPVETMSDRPAMRADGGSAVLWQLHQKQAAADAARARATAPHPNLPAHDPFALRLAAVLAVIIGLWVSWGEGWPRLANAFSPDFSVSIERSEIAIDAWTTPPAYTGAAPLFLSSTEPQADAYTVPQNSILKVRVDGAANIPAFAAAEDSSELTEFTTLEGIPGAFEAQTTLVTGQTLKVMDGAEELAGWTFAIIQDNPPKIEMPEPVGVSRRLAIRLVYQASDDYGVEKVAATIALDPDATDAGTAPGKPTEFELPIRGLSPQTAHGETYRDLLPHPFAGLPVVVTLTATDSAGQTGSSEPFKMTLPERAFVNEVARALIEERKILTLTPDHRLMVAEALDAILTYPDGLFESLTPYLGIRVSAERLKAAGDPASIASVVDLLWHTALRLEDGKLSNTLADLRAAQKALQEALERGASDAEIQALMDNLRNAMDQYLAEMARKAMEDMAEGQAGEQQPADDPNSIDRDQLQQMLDSIQDMAQTGATEAAQEMLAQLQNMLENLEMGVQQGNQQMGQQEQAMNQALSELSDMIAEQQRLMDRTLRESQGMEQRQNGQRSGQQGQQGQRQQGQRGEQGQQGQQGQRGQQGQMGEMSRPGQGGQPGEQGQMRPGEQGGQANGRGQRGQQGLAEGQNSLRQQLGEIMRQLGENGPEIPGALGRAERAMRDAESALGEGETAGALPPQRDAIDQLRNGAQALARELMQRMQQTAEGEGQGESGARGERSANGRNEDPLGRPRAQTGQDFGDRVKIPSERIMKSAREIARELRKRSSERSRPADELDYLKRLLERF